MSNVSIVRLPEVRRRTGLSRSSIYAKVAVGEFPAPIKLSQRAIGWIESEIEQWLRQRIAASRKTSA